jgi:hypothetical protein
MSSSAPLQSAIVLVEDVAVAVTLVSVIVVDVWVAVALVSVTVLTVCVRVVAV